MDNSTWIFIAVAAAVAVALIALIAVAVRRRGAPARNEVRRTEAREHRGALTPGAAGECLETST